MPKPAWKAYQEEAAAFFRDLDMDATTDEVLEGARGRHAIDVTVRTRRAGVGQLWIVECKLWNRAVSKDKVLVLAGVVSDVGADRGLLLSESGFQAGAVRSAGLSNITLSSLSDLRDNAADEKTEIDARTALKRLVLLEKRVSDLIDRGEPIRGGTVQMIVVARLSLAVGGLQKALAGILPTLIDMTPENKGIRARTLREAAGKAEAVAEWVEWEVARQEIAGGMNRPSC